jgi:hypothetical protein
VLRFWRVLGSEKSLCSDNIDGVAIDLEESGAEEA